MQITINLIKKPLIIMFFLFCFVEIIITFLFMVLYKITLKKNQNLINQVYIKNTEEFLNSFSILLSTKIVETKKYLLLFQKHMTFLNGKILNENYLNNFQNCILTEISDNNYKGDLIDFLEQEKKFSLSNKELLKNLKNIEYLNKISYFPNLNDFHVYNEICYALIFLKTWEINNLIALREKQIILNFTIYFDNNIFIYPPKIIDEKTYKSIPFSSISFSNQNYFFYKFEMRNFNLLSNICTNFKINNKKHFICSTLNISRILENTYFNTFYFVNNLIIKNDNYLNLSYSSNKLLFSESYNLFNYKEYEDFQILSNNQNPCLFHSIYFDLVKNINLTSKQKKGLVNEYKSNVKQLLNYLKENNINENLFLNYSVTQSYLYYKYNNKGEKIPNGNYKNIRKGKFLFYIKKIIGSIDNENNNIFVNKRDILFYSILILKQNDDNTIIEFMSIYYFKCIRNFIYFISIIFLGSVIIYIIFEFIMNIIFNPIKQFTKNIKNIIEQILKNENKKFSNNYDNPKNKLTLFSQKNSKSIDKKILLNFKSNFINYTNSELKEIQNIINFLQKILLIRNNSTPYQKRAEFYQSISSEIPKELTLKIFSCQIIIGYYYIQNNNYLKGIKELENLERKIKKQKKLIISKSNINDINLRNLSNYYGIYINDYSDLNIFNNPNNFISLQYISQKCHFFIGFSYYFLFKQLKKNMKKNKNDINLLNNQNMEKMNFYLLNAINHFKLSYRINNILHINLIKNIIILIYLSKCYISLNNRQIDDSNKCLKKCFIVLSKFNELIVNLIKNSNCKVNSRIMLIINGILIEFILYNIGKFAYKIGKFKVAYFTFFNMLHLSFYENENLHLKSFKWINNINQKFKNEIMELNKIFPSGRKKTKRITTKNIKKNFQLNLLDVKQKFISKNLIEYFKENLKDILIKKKFGKFLLFQNNEQNILFDIINILENIKFENNQISKEKYLNLIHNYLNKNLNIDLLLNSIITFPQYEKTYSLIDKKLNKYMKNERKKVIIIISETFLKNIYSLKSFSSFLMNTLSKFIEEEDKIGFLYLTNLGIKIKIDLNIKKENLNIIIIELNKLKQYDNNDINQNFFYTTSFDYAIEMIKNDLQNNPDEKFNHYIFSFSQINELRYETKEKTKFQINQINYLNIGIFFFIFNNYQDIHNKIKHYWIFSQKFIEGIIIIIENYKMIKLGFANLNVGQKQKNLLSYDIDNIKNVI